MCAYLLYSLGIYVLKPFSHVARSRALSRMHYPIKEKNRARGLFVVIEFAIESHKQTSSATVLKILVYIPHVLLPIRSANRTSTREPRSISYNPLSRSQCLIRGDARSPLPPSPSPFLPLIAPYNTTTSRRSRSRLSPRALHALRHLDLIITELFPSPLPARTESLPHLAVELPLLPHLRPDKNTARIRL